MAYKFQLGSFTASGSIKAEEGFDAGDNNITNVADIAVDTISADGNNIDISMTDNQSAAFAIKEGSSTYLQVDTTNSSEQIKLNLDTLMDTNAQLVFRAAEQSVHSYAADSLRIQASASLQLNVNSQTAIDIGAEGVQMRKDLEMSGSQKISYGENMESGKFLVSDGNSYASVALSGDATLASNGALTIANDAVDNNMLANMTRGTVKVGGTSNAPTDLDAKTSGQILVGDGTDIVSVAVSGDATLAADGALPIASNAVEGSMLNSNAVDDSSIEISSNALQVKAGGITNTMLSGAIANAKLENSDVTIGSTAVALGATQTSFSGLTGLDFTAASAAIASSIGANNLTLGGSTSTVIVAGNLTVQGTTTTVDSTTINISSSFTFEGLADDFETTLNIVDPTADRTVSLPNQDGVLAILSPSLSDSELATAITAAPAEINLLDAGAGSSVTLADGDGLIIFDATDSNNGKKVLMSDIKTYIGASTLDVASKADGDTLAEGVNYFADLSADATVTLPGSPSVGQSVFIKARNLTSGATVIINRAGSQTIDGETSIVLESPFAAVRLVYVANNDWRVF